MKNDTEINYTHTKYTHNPTSAEQVLPFVFDILNPKSVLDIGCGNGSWLKVCKDIGALEVFGVDGINIEEKELYISKNEFFVQNLSLSLDLKRKFDLIISLEVAEHLPEVTADTFISNLTNHSDFILFSAAIPGQGGQFHLNEQWPQYWNDKFQRHGFVAYDILRSRFWDDENVLWWYKQNMLFFVKKGEEKFKKFTPTRRVLPLIHPNLYNKKIFKPKYLKSKKEVINSLLTTLKYLIKK